MKVKCSVLSCPSKSYGTNKSKVSWHCFPRDGNVLETWLKNVGKNIDLSKFTRDSRICSVHFDEKDFKRGRTGRHLLSKQAIPSIFTSLNFGNNVAELPQRIPLQELNCYLPLIPNGSSHYSVSESKTNLVLRSVDAPLSPSLNVDADIALTNHKHCSECHAPINSSLNIDAHPTPTCKCQGSMVLAGVEAPLSASPYNPIMDTRNIAELPKATIGPSQQQQAEEQLTQDVDADLTPSTCELHSDLLERQASVGFETVNPPLHPIEWRGNTW